MARPKIENNHGDQRGKIPDWSAVRSLFENTGIIIDEYDKGIIEVLKDEKLMEEAIKTLRPLNLISVVFPLLFIWNIREVFISLRKTYALREINNYCQQIFPYEKII